MIDKDCRNKCEQGFKEAVCIHTDKVYDSCRDKDCLENIRVYLTAQGQGIVDRAINVKCTKAEVIWIFSDIEAVPFNRGFYSVDLKYFFRITLAVFTGLGRPTEVEGLATFDKKVILFGSEGNAKIFASKYKEDAFDPQLWRKTNMPSAIVEASDNKVSVLIKYFAPFFHRIVYNLRPVQVLVMHIHRADLRIIISFIIVNPLIRIAARGVYRYLIFPVPDLAAAPCLLDRAEYMKKLAHTFFLGIVRN